MVRSGDADGMVSGAMCTTANTIRPALQVGWPWEGRGEAHVGIKMWGLLPAMPAARCSAGQELSLQPPALHQPLMLHCHCTLLTTILQVLKTPQKTLVSSIFFMCLPDKVGLVGHCFQLQVGVGECAYARHSNTLCSARFRLTFGFILAPFVIHLPSLSTAGAGVRRLRGKRGADPRGAVPGTAWQSQNQIRAPVLLAN